LNAAICIAHQFGMVLRDAVIIDHHIIILSAPQGDAFRERNLDFLTVFENKGEFCHVDVRQFLPMVL